MCFSCHPNLMTAILSCLVYIYICIYIYTHTHSTNLRRSCIIRNKNITGNAETPFLLSKVNELTGGASLAASILFLLFQHNFSYISNFTFHILIHNLCLNLLKVNWNSLLEHMSVKMYLHYNFFFPIHFHLHQQLPRVNPFFFNLIFLTNSQTWHL